MKLKRKLNKKITSDQPMINPPTLISSIVPNATKIKIKEGLRSLHGPTDE